MSELNLGQHISQQFNEELEDVRKRVLLMGGIVEEQLAKGIKALVRGDTVLAAEVLQNDYRVNVMEVEIDEDKKIWQRLIRPVKQHRQRMTSDWLRRYPEEQFRSLRKRTRFA